MTRRTATAPATAPEPSAGTVSGTELRLEGIRTQRWGFDWHRGLCSARSGGARLLALGPLDPPPPQSRPLGASSSCSGAAPRPGARGPGAMRASLLLSVLRPAGPVAVGISLGFTLSLLSVTWVEEPCGPGPPQPGDSELPPRGNTNAARRPNSVQPGAEREKPGAGAGAVENWEPRVLPYHPAQPGQAAKKAVR